MRRDAELRKAIPWIAAFVAIGIAMVAGDPATAAKKPPEPPPPPDTGLIYYGGTVGTEFGLCSMKGDGTSQTLLFTDCSGSDDPCEPSRGLHYCAECGREVRWFLRLFEYTTADDYEYPNGLPRGELYAECEGGHQVRLTEAPDLEPESGMGQDYTGPGFYDSAYPRWSEDDTVVSYMGKRWVDSYVDENGNRVPAEVTEFGLFTLTIDPDDLDNHAPGDPTHHALEIDTVNDGNWAGGRMWANCDISPDGSEIVFYGEVDDVLGLYYSSAADNWQSVKISGGGYRPRFTPDGSAILFHAGGSIYRMDPDPASNPNLTATVALRKPADSKTKAFSLDFGQWSPNATHITYLLWTTTFKGDNQSTVAEVWQARSDGTYPTLLTSGFPVGWR
ncbi:MAG: hypothetical protein MUE73_09285 [Planctomycetes bacterium]|jgi:hypothetical protein|nr:hypothetical protein [Planctomycetota bacterium]